MRIGDKVKVCACSGVDSGRSGVVIDWRAVPTNGGGVPQLGEGHYKPMDRRRECAIREDSGRVFTMFRNRLIRV